MQNIDIRQAIQKSRFKQWEIANKLNISEYTFCKKLRREMSKEEKEEILQSINELKSKLEKMED